MTYLDYAVLLSSRMAQNVRTSGARSISEVATRAITRQTNSIIDYRESGREFEVANWTLQ